MARDVRSAILSVLTVSREELENTVIIHARPLAETIWLLGLGEEYHDVKTVRVEKIPPRPMHDVPPLSMIAHKIDLEIPVEIIEVRRVTKTGREEAGGVAVYFVREPPIERGTLQVYAYLRQRVGEMGVSKPGEFLSFVADTFAENNIDPDLAFREPFVKSAIYYVYRDMLGYGPLEIPMLDYNIEDISWFSYDGPVEVVDRQVNTVYPNYIFTMTNIFIDPAMPDSLKKFWMSRVIQSIVARGRGGITVARPIAELRIPDPTGRGFHRLAAHLDIISRSPGLTIRKFPQRRHSLTELIRNGTVSPLMAAYFLIQLMHQGFILVIGETGSGKTTLLGALISALPTFRKVITIEDTPELSTPAHNWHPLYTRRAPRDSELEDVDYSRLVVHSLRHRGTVITLGEVRGVEMSDLVQAAASGHAAVCLPADEVVLAWLDGEERPRLATMRELYDWAIEGKSYSVLSLGLAGRGAPVWRRVTRIYRVHTRDWIVIRTERGRIVKATPDHRLPIRRNKKKVTEVRASEIRVGDELIIAPRLPHTNTIRYVKVDGVLVPLSKDLGKFYAFCLLGACVENTSSMTLPKEAFALLSRIPLPIPVKESARGVQTRSVFAFRLIGELTRVIRDTPLSLPREFAEGIAEVLGRTTVKLRDKRVLSGLHFMLRTIGVDSVVKDGKLKILGRVDNIEYERVVSVEKIRLDGLEEAYDIEVEETHNFIIGNSICSLNCTFHAQDPKTVLARIISPPINVAPENLRLISSIAHISLTKTYAGGFPRTVRRVIRVYEILDVKERTVHSIETFTWNPMTDQHSPPPTDRGLVELWFRSRTLRTIGYNLYMDEAPRILVELKLLATFLKRFTDEEVMDIEELHYKITALYKEIDKYVERLWQRRYAKLFKPLIERIKKEGPMMTSIGI